MADSQLGTVGECSSLLAFVLFSLQVQQVLQILNGVVEATRFAVGCLRRIRCVACRAPFRAVTIIQLSLQPLHRQTCPMLVVLPRTPW